MAASRVYLVQVRDKPTPGRVGRWQATPHSLCAHLDDAFLRKASLENENRGLDREYRVHVLEGSNSIEPPVATVRDEEEI